MDDRVHHRAAVLGLAATMTLAILGAIGSIAAQPVAGMLPVAAASQPAEGTTAVAAARQPAEGTPAVAAASPPAGRAS